MSQKSKPKESGTQTVPQQVETQSGPVTQTTPAAPEQPTVPTTAKQLRETAHALVNVQPRDASGKFLSNADKSRTLVEKRRTYVEHTVDKVARLLEIPYEQLQLEADDDSETAMIKCLILGVYNASDEKGGLGAKVKVWEAINRVLGLGTVDKEEKTSNTFSVVIVDPLAGLTPEERAEALKGAAEYKPPVRKTKPSWVDAEPATASQSTIDGQYIADVAPDTYIPRNPRGSV